VIANLPYLTSDEASSGEGSLRHEPRAALDGGPDGLAMVRRLLDQLPERLARGGTALLEIGADQADAVREHAAGLHVPATVGTLRDLAGFERVVRIDRP
jgi:release factor glutamine methyltransferase